MTIITGQEREAVYKTIYSRRDVRSQFIARPIEDDVLMRILTAAHHAPSVGFSQPWDFIVIEDSAVKSEIKQAFDEANQEAADMFEGERKALYQKLKLQGIFEAPINLCITCDRTRNGPVVLGKTHQKDMDIYSTVCAVQNLWLAARAENIGVGWVSIIDLDELKRILKIPEHIVPIAYLCVGYVSEFDEKPELEKMGWLSRDALEPLIHKDTYKNK
ncbi:MAG: 5,6-dimethylbenzimidazole synthase [Cellvibrionales bacterium]|nr:5,6-dimethylbenzimidazole synthase [Cellvibrionales bacterium]